MESSFCTWTWDLPGTEMLINIVPTSPELLGEEDASMFSIWAGSKGRSGKRRVGFSLLFEGRLSGKHLYFIIPGKAPSIR